MHLPTEKSKPKDHLRDFPILIYGRSKIGKTSLASKFDDPLFLLTEPGVGELEIYSVHIKSWKTFKEVLKELGENKKKYKTVVIDTIDELYNMCLEYVCEEMDIDHPTDAPYGKGWNAVTREWTKMMTRLHQQNRGIIYISHADEKDIEQLDGEIKSMTSPTMSKQARKYAEAVVDLFVYYFYKGDKRYLRVRGTEEVYAGGRLTKKHFIGIKTIPAGKDEDEAYKNFIDAFNNKLVVDLNPQPKFKLKK